MKKICSIVFFIVFIISVIYYKVDYNYPQIAQKTQTYLVNLLYSNNYDDNMQLGKNEFDKSNYENAILYYNIALKQKQNSFDAYYYRGLSKLNLNKELDAINDFKKAVELNSENIDTIFRRAILLMQYPFYNLSFKRYFIKEKNSTEDIKSSYYTFVQKELDKVIHAQPNNSDAFVYRGIAKTRIGDFDDALKDFNYAIHLSPKNSFAYLSKGDMYLDFVDYKEYQTEQKNTKTLPNYTELLYNNSSPHLSLKEEKGNPYKQYKNEYLFAINNYNKAISLNPKDEDAYFNRGIAHWLINNYIKSINDFSKVLSINPGNKDAFINMIYVEIDLARYYKDKNKNLYNELITKINQDYYSLNAKYTKENSNLKELVLLKEEIDEENNYINKIQIK